MNCATCCPSSERSGKIVKWPLLLPLLLQQVVPQLVPEVTGAATIDLLGAMITVTATGGTEAMKDTGLQDTSKPPFPLSIFSELLTVF